MSNSLDVWVQHEPVIPRCQGNAQRRAGSAASLGIAGGSGQVRTLHEVLRHVLPGHALRFVVIGRTFLVSVGQRDDRPAEAGDTLTPAPCPLRTRLATPASMAYGCTTRSTAPG